MGLTFRYDQRRYVRMGKRTIKDGEGVVIWNRLGESRVVIGPKLEYMWFSTLHFMKLFAADSSQYLSIRFRDGKRENRAGPCKVFLNPVLHDSISVHKAGQLPSQQHCVIARVMKDVAEGSANPGGEENEVEMIEKPGNNCHFEVIQRGPAQYIPPGEAQLLHTHELCDGAESGGGSVGIIYTGRRTKTHACEFLDKNGQLCSISIELDLSVADIDTCLGSSWYPVQDVMNALQADIRAVGATYDLEGLLVPELRAKFLAEVNGLLNLADSGVKITASSRGLVILKSSIVSFGGALGVKLEEQAAAADKLQQAIAKLAHEEEVRKNTVEINRRKVESEAALKEKQMEADALLEQKRVDEELALQEKKTMKKLALLETENDTHIRLLAQRNAQTVELIANLAKCEIPMEKFFENNKICDMRNFQ